MMSSKNNGFTAGDIERYHSGQMSSEERHALEKAALDDPFLADALEGYAFTSTPKGDLARIRSRLQEHLDQKKVIPFSQKYRWLSIAALFIIIAGTAWLVYDLSNKGVQPSSVAVQKEVRPEENGSKVIPNQQVSADSNIQATSPVDQQINKNREKANSDKKEGDLNNKFSNEQARENVVISNSRNNQSNGYYNKEVNSNSDRRMLARPNQAEGNKGNIESIEISRNPFSSTAKAKDVADENKDNSNVASKVVITSAPAARVRMEEKNDSVKHIDVVLHPLPKDSQPEMQELVINNSQQKNLEKYPRVTVDTLEPADGYVQFDDYVANNLNMPEDIKTKIPAGEIQLSFDVDQNGKPVNITVVKSLCEKCDEEAIRLLKEGPKWKKKNNRKGKITIKF